MTKDQLSSPVPVCLAASCTHPAAPGYQLCPADRQQLGDWLAQLGQEYQRLDASPSMQAPTAGVSGGGLASHRSVGDLDVMVLRDARSRERDGEDPDGNRGRGVLEVLAAYATLVRSERGLTAPTRELVIRLRPERAPGPLCAAYAVLRSPCAHPSCRAGVVLHTVPAAPNVLSERALLAAHLDWICRQGWAGEFRGEVRALWGLLRAANGHGAEKPRVRCPACGASARWATGAVQCTACGVTTAGLDILTKRGAAA